MELSDFRIQANDGEEIDLIDGYIHKGLDWVEHSTVSLDTKFEEVVGSWFSFTPEEKVEILSEFMKLYSDEA